MIYLRNVFTKPFNFFLFEVTMLQLEDVYFDFGWVPSWQQHCDVKYIPPSRLSRHQRNVIYTFLTYRETWLQLKVTEHVLQKKSGPEKGIFLWLPLGIVRWKILNLLVNVTLQLIFPLSLVVCSPFYTKVVTRKVMEKQSGNNILPYNFFFLDFMSL